MSDGEAAGWKDTDRPRRLTDLWHREQEGVYILDPHGGLIHRLNETASRMWELCDGSSDIATMAARLAAELGGTQAEAAAALTNLLGQLEKLGLLAPAPGGDAG